jgi:4-hydroxybenzoyl-CoA thioesterase
MARVTIELPEQFAFSTELDVRITDINYGNHLGNDALLGLLHEARVRFLAALGFSEFDCGGCGIIMCDAAIVYLAQARYGQTLVCDVAVQEPTRISCEIVYRMRDKVNNAEVARAKTGIVFFDYAQGKIARMPAAFREKLPLV